MILGVKVLRRFVKSNAALIPELASDSWTHSFDRWSRAFDPRSQPFDPWSESHIPRYYPVRKWLFSHFLLHMLWKLKWTRCVPTFSSSRKWRELANQFQEQIMYQSKATSTRVSIPCWSWNRQCDGLIPFLPSVLLPSQHNYDVKWPHFYFALAWERERRGDKSYCQHLTVSSSSSSALNFSTFKRLKE